MRIRSTKNPLSPKKVWDSEISPVLNSGSQSRKPPPIKIAFCDFSSFGLRITIKEPLPLSNTHFGISRVCDAGSKARTLHQIKYEGIGDMQGPFWAPVRGSSFWLFQKRNTDIGLHLIWNLIEFALKIFMKCFTLENRIWDERCLKDLRLTQWNTVSFTTQQYKASIGNRQKGSYITCLWQTL